MRIRLSDHGRQYVKSAFKGMYFGNKIKQPTETGWRKTAVKIYGFFSIGWFFLISVGLSLAASSLFEGFGLLIALVGMVSAPVVIDYEPLSIVRANAPGFADQIHVENGQSVREGDLLVSLGNLDLRSELKSVEVDIRISGLRINAYLEDEDISSLQLERELLASKLERQEELQELIDTLEVRAPQDGIVLGLDLASKEHTYLQPGDEILSIGKQGEVHGIALARQQDVQWLRNHDNGHVYLKIWGRSESNFVDGEIKQIDPRARDDAPHKAFAASNGGPLAVVSRGQTEAGAEQSEVREEEDDMMLTQPRVPVEIRLSASDAETLWAGQTGQMYLRGREESLGGYLAANVMRFIRHNNYRTHGL